MSVLKRLGLVLGAALLVTGCAGYSDDTKINELEDDQVEDLCAEICDNQEKWEIKCDSDGNEIVFSGGDSPAAECKTECGAFKKATDSCTATVGDVRSLNEKPATCAEATAQFGKALTLAACFPAS